jgi:hypothetical protein
MAVKDSFSDTHTCSNRMMGALHTKAGYRVLFPIIQALPLYPTVSHSIYTIYRGKVSICAVPTGAWFWFG